MLVPSLLMVWLSAAPEVADPGVVPLGPHPIHHAESVAFRSPNEGLMSDQDGRLYVTHDGGAGWTRDEALERAIFGRGGLAEGARFLRRITWLDENEGLAFVPNRKLALLTLDGGKTWSKSDLGERGEADDAVDSAPAWSDTMKETLARVRKGSLFSPRSGRVITLERIARNRNRRWGVAGAMTFASDAGGPWYRLKDLPSPATEIAVVELGDLIAQTRDGMVVGDGVQDWREAREIDRIDFRRLTGVATASNDPRRSRLLPISRRRGHARE